MLDINLGNKTLCTGVLVALILAYGMVNFDSAKTSASAFSWTSNQRPVPAAVTEVDAVAQAQDQTPVVDESSLNHWERKELRRQKSL